MENLKDNEIKQAFGAKKVMTIPELTKLMNYTPRTVQRRLQLWGAISSYNQNGRYYGSEFYER